MAYFIYDGGECREYATVEEALDDATQAIGYAREACDPEWPMYTASIAVYEASSGCEEPCEDGVMIFCATEVEIEQPEYVEDGIYYCDYAMRPVTSETTP